MPRTVKSHRAHAAVAYALKIGKLVKPDACEQCGRQDSKLEAAHHDYDKKLDVKWLCVGCHRSWDKQEPKGGTPATEERMQKLDGIQDRVIELKRVPGRYMERRGTGERTIQRSRTPWQRLSRN
jgi:hypothetical protein